MRGAWLYEGIKHTVATALGQVLTPEEIKRGGTGSETNKAFDIYFQLHKKEDVKVACALRNLRNSVRGELVYFDLRKEN